MSANETGTALDIAAGNDADGEALASHEFAGEELEAMAPTVAPEEEASPEESGSADTAATPAAGEDQAGEVDGDAESAGQPTEPQDDRAWYVIHCYSGYESKVKHNLEQRIDTMQMQDQIFQVVVPTEDEIEVRDGKRRVIERRVFPGYILVQMKLSDDSWYVVRNTPGVTGFVGMGNEPTPLRPEEVQAILKRMEAEAPRIKVTFRSGQKVRIIDGPFNEFIGVVSEIDMERAKVRVMVSFFGRETPVELDFLQVEKA
jgi:transcriptional antiterminator NusG